MHAPSKGGENHSTAHRLSPKAAAYTSRVPRASTPTSTPRGYHHGNLRHALVAQGLELLEECGLAQFSLRGIAARVGVSHAAPKNHFGNLRGLLSAMAAEGYRLCVVDIRQRIARAAAAQAHEPESWRQLLALVCGYVEFARAHPQLFTLMYSSQHCNYRQPDLAEHADEGYRQLRQISAVVLGLPQEPPFNPYTAPNAGASALLVQAELLVWVTVHGYALLMINGMMEPGLGPTARLGPSLGYCPTITEVAGQLHQQLQQLGCSAGPSALAAQALAPAPQPVRT